MCAQVPPTLSAVQTETRMACTHNDDWSCPRLVAACHVGLQHNGRRRIARQAASRRPLTLHGKSSCHTSKLQPSSGLVVSWQMTQAAAVRGLKPPLWLIPSVVSHAGSPAPATDFVCKLTCQSGLGAAGNANASSLPAPGIFDPPYAIDNGASHLPLSTKVTC